MKELEMRICYFFAVFASLVVVASAGKNDLYNGYTVHNVHVEDRSDLRVLQELEIDLNLDFWQRGVPGHRDAVIMVSKENREAFLEQLDYNGLQHEVHIENVVEVLNKEQEELDLWRRSRNSRMFPFQDYSRYAEIDAYLERIAAQYPDIVTIVNAGQSFEGRNVKYLKISTSNFTDVTKPIYFMNAMIHAREWVTAPVALYSIHRLVEEVRASDRDILESTDWIIMPLVNPDGYEYTHTDVECYQRNYWAWRPNILNLWETSTAQGQSGFVKYHKLERLWRRTRSYNPAVSETCYGVDGNRNFNVSFNTIGVSSDPCSNTYPGAVAFSEVEMTYIRDVLHEYLDRIQLYLDIHSQGNLVLFAYGDDSLPTNAVLLHHVGAIMGAAIDAYKMPDALYYLVGNSALLLYGTSGTAQDYAQFVGVPFSFTLELPGYGYGHDVPPQYMEQIIEETWQGIVASARASLLYYQARISGQT